MFVYLTTNCINGKRYIGKSTRDPNVPYFGSGSVILKALRKYGTENFQRTFICFCDTEDELNAREKELIALWRPEYNIAEGGEGGNPYKYMSPERYAEVCRNNSESKKGRKNGPHSAETRHKLSIANTGKQVSEETRQKLRVANTGKKHPPGVGKKIGDAHRGMKRSAETKRKIGEAHKGVPKSPEHRSKLSAANKGKKRPPEVRRKISESQKGISRSSTAKQNMSAARKEVVARQRMDQMLYYW